MTNKRLLFVSGSLGLGHVVRDIEIVKALRKIDSAIEVYWLADSPASIVLEQAEERVLPEAKLWARANEQLTRFAEGYDANLIKWILSMRQGWKANAEVVAKLLAQEHFDLVVGDEAYELLTMRVGNRDFRNFRFIMIYDAIGADCVTKSPKDAIATYMINRLWAKGLQVGKVAADRNLFIGEPEDIPDKKFGFNLPNRRKLAIKHLDFVGYVLPFSPGEYENKEVTRLRLGYGNEPLIVCTIGGTSAGKELLNLCAQTYPILKKKLSGLKMILVCGPMLTPSSIEAPEGVEVRGYVPELYKHLAAADLCVVTGGGTVTLELTALKRPFLYFPLKKHCEQEIDVASRCKRNHAGIKMDFSKTSPEKLAKTILTNFNKPISYSRLSGNGAQKAAKIIAEILNEKPN